LSWNTEVTEARSEFTESVPKARICHRIIEGKRAEKIRFRVQHDGKL